VARASGALMAWSPRAGRRGGTLASGLVAASRCQDATSELAGATGRTSDKEEGTGVHQKGGSTVW
jgi:hypothetical protein